MREAPEPVRLTASLERWPGGPKARLAYRVLRVIALGLYTSILSAFHIGWRDLSVGTWIARLQPREYTLRTTGWVRFVFCRQTPVEKFVGWNCGVVRASHNLPSYWSPRDWHCICDPPYLGCFGLRVARLVGPRAGLVRIIVVQDLPPSRTTSHAVANYCAPSFHVSRNHQAHRSTEEAGWPSLMGGSQCLHPCLTVDASLRVETRANFRSRAAEGLR